MNPRDTAPHDPLVTASRRKCLLFAVPLLRANLAIIEATIRRFNDARRPGPPWELSGRLPAVPAAIEVVERAADGAAEPAEEAAVRETIMIAKEAAIMDQDFEIAAYFRDVQDVLSVGYPDWPPRSPYHVRAARALRNGPLAGFRPDAAGVVEQREADEYRAACACYLTDVFGPHPVAQFSPDWRTDTAVALARTVYESREFSAMPILADALQDAGCDSDDVLAHCRDTAQVHVRGCWVCDLVLGKE